MYVDGDELNFTLIGDELLHEQLKVFAPHFNIPATNKPNAISGNLSILKPGIGIVGNYLREKEDKPEMDTISKRLNFVNINN